MNIGELMDIVRADYLDDANSGHLWPDTFLLRSFREAERQACNRANLLFDDSTRQLTQIKLLDGKASYPLSQKVNVIQYVGLGGVQIHQKSEEELNRKFPAWRTLTGLTKACPWFLVRGRNIRFVPTPTASQDATFVQDGVPLGGVDALGDAVPLLAGDTWYNTATAVLSVFDGAVWTANPNAVLGVVQLEIFRAPLVECVDESYEPEIPEAYHRDLIYWVLHEAYKKQDGDTFNQERADYFLARFTQVFGDYVPAKVRLNQLEQDNSLTVRPAAYGRGRTGHDDWGDERGHW